MASPTVIAELLVSLGIETKDADKAAQAVKGVKDEATDLKDKGGSALKGFSTVFAVTAGDIAGAAKTVANTIKNAAIEAFKFVDDTTKELAKLSRDAKASGIGTEEFQRLSFAAEKSGTNVETLGKATRKLNAQLFDAAKGGAEPFNEALGEIGLSFQDLQGRSTTDQLGLLGDALNKVSDPAKRAALAAKLLGEEGGPQLAGLLSEGTVGLQAMTEAATGVIPDEAIRKSIEFQQTMTEFNGVIKEIRAEIATAFAPILREVIDRFREWMQENRAFLELGLSIAVDVLTESFRSLSTLVDSSVSSLKELMTLTAALTQLVGEESVPVWDDLAKSILSVRNPVNDVAKAVKLLINAIENLFAKIPMLKSLAASMGISVGEGTAGEERRRQEYEDNKNRMGQARQGALAAQDAAANFAFAQSLATANQNLAKQSAANIVAVTAKPGEKFSAGDKERLLGSGYTPAEVSAMEKANVKAGRRGGGRKPKETPKPDAAKEEAPIRQLTNFEQLLAQTLGPGFELSNLPSVRQVPMTEAQIKPEAVVNITNYSFNNDIVVEGTVDPIETAKQVASAIKREFNARLSRAAQSTNSNVVR